MKLVLLFSLAVTLPAAFGLQFVVTNSRLPAPVELHSAVYDGDDSIYLIGGYDGLRRDDVLKFSLSTGATERVGSFQRISQGTAALHGDQLFYFGGKIHIDGYTDKVYSYNTRTNTYSVTSSTLPVAMRSMTLAHDSANGLIYNFGGINNNGFTYHDYILRYNPATNQMTTLGRLPEGRGAAAAVFDSSAGVAYIFGGSVPINHESFSDEILKFNPATNAVTKLSAKLPSLVYYSSAVYAKGQVYISGQNDLFRFNPATERVEVLDVEGWPRYMLGAPTVYVPKLDRIYMFGGYGNYAAEAPVDRVDISYLDLSD